MTYNVTNRPRDRREQQILFAGTVIPAQSTAPLAKTASIMGSGSRATLFTVSSSYCAPPVRRMRNLFD